MDTEWQFPYAFAGIGSRQTPIKCPNGWQEAMKQYHDFKNFYWILLLSLLHANNMFN